MVDVSGKAGSARSATAAGGCYSALKCVAALRDGTVPKVMHWPWPRIAGIQAAKRPPI